MFKPVYGVGGVLDVALSAPSNMMQPSTAAYSQMETILGEGGTDHTYAVLNDGVAVEVVKIITLGDGLAEIARAIDGTTATAFPIGTAIEFVLTAAAVGDIVADAIDAAALPSGLTFEINDPHTIGQVGSVVTVDIVKLPLVSPDATIDVTTVGDGYGVDIERGAFGCCPETE